MEPLIIISPSVNDTQKEITLSRAYFNAIRMAGGYGVACDYYDIEETILKADGILLTGGGDIAPELTGDEADEEQHIGQIVRSRDLFEMELVRAALEKDIPILGICRGMQIIGAFGGSNIIQHIEGHRQDIDKDKPFHDVTLLKDSLLYKIVQKSILSVNSFHHQAVGEGFKGLISAESGDNIKEAIEFEDKRFVLGVQWHPELMIEHAEHLNIFKAFVQACKSKGWEI